MSDLKLKMPEGFPRTQIKSSLVDKAGRSVDLRRMGGRNRRSRLSNKASLIL
jgi:hypothetical protein